VSRNCKLDREFICVIIVESIEPALRPWRAGQIRVHVTSAYEGAVTDMDLKLQPSIEM
jgi:hypothetical protein